MRISTLVLIVLTAMMTQSCKIEMPSLINLIGSHWPGSERRRNSYGFELSQAMKMRGEFDDIILIGWNQTEWHGRLTEGIILSTGIPRENTTFMGEFTKKNYFPWRPFFELKKDGENFGLDIFVSDDREEDGSDGYYTALRKTAKVANVSEFMPFTHPNDVSRLEEIDNTLFVTATSNAIWQGWDGDNDLYRRQHPYWAADRIRVARDLRTRLEPRYTSLLRAHNTGKVIAVKGARVVKGKVEPYEHAVKCGDIKESCFTIVPAQTSLRGSARLSAIAFYLSQFYETPEEIVEVLGACAIDVGERGIDREYGRGVINLLCPPVLKKELEVVSSHLEATEEEKETPAGGALEGLWEAEEIPLAVHIPEVLRQTLQLRYDGTVNGTIEFTEETAKVDFSAKAAINATFLFPIEVTAEEQIQSEVTYATAEQSLFLAGAEGFAYTATADSLHLIRSYSLNEVLLLLPYPFWTMVDLDSKDFFVDDPIQIKISFGKIKYPTAPRKVREKAKTDTTITLVWEEPEEARDSPVDRYRITQYTDSACTVISAVKETEEQEVTFKNLEEETDYFFTVEAGNTAGWGEKSACVTVRTGEKRLRGDFDGNGLINLADYDLFVDAWASREGDPNYREYIDLNADGIINLVDFQIFSDIWKEHNQ